MNVAAGPKLAAAVTNAGKPCSRDPSEQSSFRTACQAASASSEAFARAPSSCRNPSTSSRAIWRTRTRPLASTSSSPRSGEARGRPTCVCSVAWLAVNGRGRPTIYPEARLHQGPALGAHRRHHQKQGHPLCLRRRRPPEGRGRQTARRRDRCHEVQPPISILTESTS